MENLLIDKEIVNNQLSVLNNTLTSQRTTKKTLLSYLEKLSNSMYENFNSYNTDNLLYLINEAQSIFECIKSNINKTLELKSSLRKFSQVESSNTEDYEKFNTEFNLWLENVNTTNSNYLNFIKDYEKFINPITNENTSTSEITETEEIIEPPLETDITSEKIEIISEPQDETTSNIEIEKNSETQNETTTETNSLENILKIDEVSQIAVLPFSSSDLEELFSDDPEKYSSLQDIIDKEYTVSLKDFENTAITRYKEAFKLAKDKSNIPLTQAITFAKRFLGEQDIEPIIIAACKNIEELDYYVECLNSNNLNNFDYFKIIKNK